MDAIHHFRGTALEAESEVEAAYVNVRETSQYAN